MICTPDRRWFRRTAALCLLIAAPGLSGTTAGDDLIARGRADLARGDGIAAEIDLRRALDSGAKRDAVAAYLGEAYLKQGKGKQAREWLGEGKFSPNAALHGFRMLGLLERLDNNLPAAGRAYDRALAVAPKDVLLWVDIGRLRYSGGEQLQAIQAAEYALAQDPENVRALEFRGQLIRDQFGIAAALPWFESALAREPDDLSVLGEYAGALGDLGRAADMLTVTRRMLLLDSSNPRAFYLLAVLAARAGNDTVARSMLNRTHGTLSALPAAVMLDGVLDLRAGNAVSAADAFERLLAMQPANVHAQLLLARAMADAGQEKALVERMSGLAARPDASPYLLTMLARAQENLGNRELAAKYLDRAATAGPPPLLLVAESNRGAVNPAVAEVRRLIMANNITGAENAAERLREDHPGSAIALSLAGDLQLAQGRGGPALDRYVGAGKVRMSESLMLRMLLAMERNGRIADQWPLITGYLAQNPSSFSGAWLAAVGAGQQKDWKRCSVLLNNLRAGAGERDARLLADLSYAQWREGDAAAAIITSHAAYELQRSSAAATQAYALSLVAEGKQPQMAKAMLDKARAIGGDNPALISATAQLRLH